MAEIASGYDLADLIRIAEAAGFPFSPVNRPSDLFADPHLLPRMLPIHMPGGGLAKLPPLPLALDDATPDLRLQPAAPGEHTDDVLRALGYGRNRIAALRETAVIR